MPINTPIHTNVQSIDRVINAGPPVVLVFWRSDCTNCRQLEPTLNRLANEYAGSVLFAKIAADDEPDLVKRYQVSRLPALVFLKDGEINATTTGAIGEQDLRLWCDYLVSGGPQPSIPSGPSEALRPDHTAPSGSSPRAESNGKTSSGAGAPVTLTDATFDQVINGDLPVLVDFWAPWCGPCHMVAPTIEALAQDFDSQLVVGKVNVDENQRVAQRYGIMSIPTMMIFRNGQVIDQVVGALPAQALRARVLPYVN